MLRLACALSMIALVPTLAAADEHGDFVTLDRAGDTDVVGVAVAGHFYDDDTSFTLRENLYLRYVVKNGVGFFGQIGVAEAFGDSSTQGISALELGGLYNVTVGDAEVSVHLGLGLPTGSSSLEGAITNLVASVDRIQDAALAVPNTLWIRPGVALKLGGRALFGQIDLGADVPVKTSGDGSTQVILHANAGIGTIQGPVALTAELSSYFIDNDGLHRVHEAAATARLVGASLVPYASYGFIFGGDTDQHAHAVMLGVEQAF